MGDVRTFLPLTAQQFQILLALSDDERHGYGIILEVAARTDGAVRLGTGTLYTALAGLDSRGLIAGRGPRSGNDRRKYYRLTPLGRSVLHAEADRLESLVKQARRKGVRPLTRPAWSRGK